MPWARETSKTCARATSRARCRRGGACMPDLVPFGKYKGQSMEALAQDAGYCEWLLGQSWLGELFPNVYTLIINHFGEPSATPEHNRLQLRFLEEKLRVQCARYVAENFGVPPPPCRPIGRSYYLAPTNHLIFEEEGIDVYWRMNQW